MQSNTEKSKTIGTDCVIKPSHASFFAMSQCMYYKSILTLVGSNYLLYNAVHRSTLMQVVVGGAPSCGNFGRTRLDSRLGSGHAD